jgi:hypothetical protein
MHSLQLQQAIRKGSHNKKEVEYLDFVISGRSLKSILGIENADYATLIGSGTKREFVKQILNIFRLKEKSYLETGRVMIYACPECGDIGCGAITAVILDLGSKIVWKDFGYETGHGGVTEEYSNIEPIEFDRQSYFEAFSKPI